MGVPLTMTYATTEGGTLVDKDPRHSLPGSVVGAMCFYGRGLQFSASDAAAFQNAMNADNPAEGQLATIADIVSRAIAEAWRDEEVSPGSGFRPGRLQERGTDNVRVPA